MSSPVQGKPITWRPLDQIPPSTSSTSAPVAELQPAVPLLQERDKRKKIKLKTKLKKGLKKLFPHMTKQKGATKVLVTGVDTWSTNKHSLINRMKF
jgi:hypothetical protein